MKKSRRRSPKAVLRLPDLEHAKSAVLNSLASPESRRSYEFAIQNFVHWYCSEPRLALNRIVVTRYRMQLEQLHLAPSTINQRLAAVRRLAYEAADAGLLSPELAAGIKRVRGVKQLGVRLGNWLTAEQGRALVDAPSLQTLSGKRDRAMLGVLLRPAFDDPTWFTSSWKMYSNAKITGPSSTWWARADTSVRSRFQAG